MRSSGRPTAAAGAPPSILLLGLLVALNALGIDSYVAALPDMQRAFGVTPARMQATVASFLIGLAAGQLLWGWLSDRFGRRSPLLAALLLCGVASLACALSPKLVGLLIARFAQGFGSAGANTIAYAIVADRWPAEARPRIYSRLAQIVGATAIAAPLVGTGLLAMASWRLIFVILGVVALAAGAWVAAAIERDEAAIAEPVANPVAGIRSVLATPGFAAGLAASALANAAMFAVVTASSFVLIGAFGWSSTDYAVYYALTSVVFIGMCQWNVALLRRFAVRTILWRASVAVAAVAAGLIAMLALVPGAFVYALATAAYLALLGLIIGNVLGIAMTNVDARRAGQAASLIGISQFVTGAVLVQFATSSWTAIYWSAAITFGASAFASLFLVSRLDRSVGTT